MFIGLVCELSSAGRHMQVVLEAGPNQIAAHSHRGQADSLMFRESQPAGTNC